MGPSNAHEGAPASLVREFYVHSTTVVLLFALWTLAVLIVTVGWYRCFVETPRTVSICFTAFRVQLLCFLALAGGALAHSG